MRVGRLWQPYVSFWRRHRLTILVVAALAAISVAGLYARSQPLDLAIFGAINTGQVGPALDILGQVGYVLGTVWFSLLLLAAFYLVGRRYFAISALGAVLLNVAFVLYVKSLTQEARPEQEVAGVRLVGIVQSELGYPSGHAAQAFLIAYLLNSYLAAPWYVQAGLYGLAGFVAWSRVYVGAHFPADVVAGAAIGFLLGVLWARSPLWPAACQRGP